MNLSGLSQENQLKILANTSEIAVEGGADSFATIFCPPGSKITELIPNNFYNGFGPRSTHQPLGQSYRRITGEVNKTNNGPFVTDYNFKINPELIERLD